MGSNFAVVHNQLIFKSMKTLDEHLNVKFIQYFGNLWCSAMDKCS